MKLLHVTTYGRADCGALLKRFNHQFDLCGQLERRIVLIASADVHESQIADPYNAAQKCYTEVEVGRIAAVPQRTDWPYNVNHAFQYTVQTLQGLMPFRPKVAGYASFLYYECDMTPLTSDWADKLDEAYTKEGKPFAGYIHQTILNPTKRKVTHMNGGGCYPLDAKPYNTKIMLAERLPWDVNGLCDEKLPQIGQLNDIYAHHYGTHSYKKGKDGLECLRGNNKDAQVIKVDLSGKIIHHGCKDGSLIDFLCQPGSHGVQGDPVTGIDSFPPLKQPPVDTPSWAEQAKADHAAGMKWRDLLAKYKVMPAKLKEALK